MEEIKRISVEFDSVLHSPRIEQSPIIESLAWDFDMEFEDDEHNANVCSKSCDVWIVSDMMQNSSFASFYDSVPSFEAVNNDIEWEFGYGKGLKDAQVTIWQLNRCPADGGNVQRTTEFKAFWDDYFNRAAGSKAAWKTLPPGGCE
ncbi:MAG: hypothetical protein OXM02_05830 [Bacteroidota bacterium]|nr:hypothetical protein [Bacteroidota bacterium]